MKKIKVKAESLNQFAELNKVNKSWSDFMESEIKESKEFNSVDREEDF
tara:strand:- start:6143 stop:6286 length:144 start_codon:yes stop_codon:yes gene_type:complete